MEVIPLKLQSQHFPFPDSLEERILQVFTAKAAPPSDAPTMTRQELLSCLASAGDFSAGPMAALRRQAGSADDAPIPETGHSAILEWLGMAMLHWQTEYPVESPLAEELHRLTPVCAAQAITDPDFLVPGRHPLHRILDTLQARAIGWQAQLGRAGQHLEKQVKQVVEQAAAILLQPQQEQAAAMAALADQVLQNSQRDESRFQRMTQRVVDTEVGRLKAAGARILAARTINALAEKYRAPAPIAEFLLGPWYDSLQLVLLKYGSDSVEWDQMDQVSAQLLEPLQPMKAGDTSHRQRIYDAATKVPKEMRKWLLSLQHDADAVAEVVELVEFSHLRVMKQQDLELQDITPIPIESDDLEAPRNTFMVPLDELEQGQWFELRQDESAILRVQLALNLEAEQQLLFVNQAGMKALEMDYAQFSSLLSRGKVRQLQTGASFSRSLAAAAGVESLQDREAIFGPYVDAATQARLDREAAEREEQESRQREEQRRREQALRAKLEAEDRQRREEEQQRRDEEARKRRAEEAEKLAPLERERIRREADERIRQAEAEQARRLQEQGSNSAEAALSGAAVSEQVKPQEDEATRIQRQRAAARQQREEQRRRREEEEAARGLDIDLPMGTWLGFHDGDVPTMAKLAVHDRDNDNYIFVNREGIKLRDVSGQELRDLMELDLIDILETRTSFRDAVNSTRDDQ